MKLKQRIAEFKYEEYDSLDDKIFKIRGIKNEDVYEFLNPSKHNLNDPFLLDNMDVAIELVCDAIREDKKICIYGDP